jgi:N utilization substance protein B
MPAARTKARRRALDILFEAEARRVEPSVVLEERVGDPDRPVNPYTESLVRGVMERATRIDEVLGTYAQGWSLDRMPAVDRNVLRIGTFEILFVDDVPDAVAVSEALVLVRELSTDESPGFVNGVLGNILRDKTRLSA